jgi:hypothetical protein
MSPALRGDVYSVWLEFSALEFATYAFDLTALLSGRYERGRSSSLHGTQTAVRRIQAVLGLAKKHRIAAVDDARSGDHRVEVYDYPLGRRYLEGKTPVPLTLRQVDLLIRQLALYRDVINESERSLSPSARPFHPRRSIPNESH